MRLLRFMASSHTFTSEKSNMSRLIERVLLQTSEPHHPLLQTALFKELQRFAFTRRFYDFSSLLLPPLPRVRHHCHGMPCGDCQVLNVTGSIDHLVPGKALAQSGLKKIGRPIGGLFKIRAAYDRRLKGSFQNRQLGAQDILKLTAVVSQRRQVHDWVSASLTSASTEADSGEASEGACCRYVLMLSMLFIARSIRALLPAL